MEDLKELKPILKRIYGEEQANLAFQKLLPILTDFKSPQTKLSPIFSEKNVILISYGDSIIEDDLRSLQILYQFVQPYLTDIFSGIHILPFFPFSSDDGFSVMNFNKVDPHLGNWSDIKAFSQHFSLMFDYVLNHISAKSDWFQSYLNEEQGYQHLAIEVAPATDLSQVTRPRSLPLLTEFTKTSGQSVQVWTTFSEDQIDLNYKSIAVLEKMVSVLLYYIQQGATILRLDAIAYLWKEIGTPCIHLPKTHEMVKLFRKILDILAPFVMILTETNVPHEENISYFGNGEDEAQMVYNFTLPPLLLYCFLKQDATVLSKWATTLGITGSTNTFLNFTASHDGIGVRPLEGILPKSEVELLCQHIRQNGGHISYRQNPDGTQSPYELNITYVDAMGKKTDRSRDTHAKRFLASQAIQYVLPGVPATYIHSLTGSRNWNDGVKKTGNFRTINREKLNLGELLSQLNDPASFRSRIFYSYLDFIKIRIEQPAFHPKAGFEILDVDPRAFGIKRFCYRQVLYCLTNISEETLHIRLTDKTPPPFFIDLITGKQHHGSSLELLPYQYVWLDRGDMCSGAGEF